MGAIEELKEITIKYPSRKIFTVMSLLKGAASGQKTQAEISLQLTDEATIEWLKAEGFTLGYGTRPDGKVIIINW
jgi:hypothetical protein